MSHFPNCCGIDTRKVEEILMNALCLCAREGIAVSQVELSHSTFKKLCEEVDHAIDSTYMTIEGPLLLCKIERRYE